MFFLSSLDLLALLVFITAWCAYAAALELSGAGRQSLNARMDRYRGVWMERMLARDMRMTDMQIMTSLQNGTAFFASTSLIAIGGAISMIRATDEVVSLLSSLPFVAPASRIVWEIKVIGLVVIFVYAFFKFAWAYRLYNYVAIMLGATPFASEKDGEEAQAHIRRTTGLFASAGRHFNRGQRAFFFALGYLGWFIGPVVLIISTIAVLIVMWRRQFVSDSLRAVADHEPPSPPQAGGAP